MKDLKALQDRREALMASGKAMTEHRDGDFDKEALATIRDEVRSLDKEIEEEKRSRVQRGKQTTGEDKMDKDLEVRALDALIRNGEASEEYRAIEADLTAGNGTEPGPGNGGSLISETVYGQVIPKLDNVAPVFAMAHKFPSINGRLKIARETSAADEKAGFVGETMDVNQLTSGFKSVTLDQKRVGGAIQLTNELINDAAVDVVSYATNRVANSLARAIEKAILLGSADGFRGIIADKEVLKKDVADVTVEGLISIFNSLHQIYQSQAAWVVSPEAFDAISKLKDGDGRYLLLNTVAMSNQDVFAYSLLGRPIYVSDALKGADKQIVFGAFDGYGLMIKKGMNLTHVTADSRQALAGGHLIVLDAYMDGEVYNPDMFVVSKVASLA